MIPPMLLVFKVFLLDLPARHESVNENGTRCKTRTRNLLIRSLCLYPIREVRIQSQRLT